MKFAFGKKFTLLKVVIPFTFSFALGYTTSTITSDDDQYHLHLRLVIENGDSLEINTESDRVVIKMEDGRQYNIWWPLPVKKEAETK